jgi:Domain of unknown function (DUF4440)
MQLGEVMKNRLVVAILGLMLAGQVQAQTETLPSMPEGAALTKAVQSADEELFTLFFTGCDPERLRGMLSGTLEFYHDKDGLVANNGADFVSQYAKNCERRKAPDAWRSRRELVVGSLHVDPVPGFGAMEVGEHLFYERQGDGPERLAGRAGFAMVWQWDAGTWRLHRVLSFGHKAAQ